MCNTGPPATASVSAPPRRGVGQRKAGIGPGGAKLKALKKKKAGRQVGLAAMNPTGTVFDTEARH